MSTPRKYHREKGQNKQDVENFANDAVSKMLTSELNRRTERDWYYLPTLVRWYGVEEHLENHFDKTLKALIVDKLREDDMNPADIDTM